MGVDTSAWRARIGRFVPRMSSGKPGHYNPSTKLWIWCVAGTYAVILTSFFYASLLLLCGDVEVNPGPSFKCMDCGASFPSRQDLELHQKRDHLGFRHCCKNCGKKYYEITDLHRHTNTCTAIPSVNEQCEAKVPIVRGRPDIVCRYGCMAQFAQACHRARHEREVHNKGLHKCSTCQAQFTDYKEFIGHAKTHRPAITHRSKQSPSVLVDQLIDDGPCSLVCQHCSKSFARLDNFNAHLARHADTNHVHCKDCGKVFNRRDNLKRHMIQHGGAAGDGANKRQRIVTPRDHYDIKMIDSSHSPKFQTTSSHYRVNFKDLDIVTIPDILEALDSLLQSIMSDMIPVVSGNDTIQFSVCNSQLDFPITTPFTRYRDFTLNSLLGEIERVLQSYEEFLLDSTLEINFTHVKIPEGSGKTLNLDDYLENKKCVIRIQNRDKICCARAIVTAKARLDRHPQWSNIRHGRGMQRDLAIQLHLDAGVEQRPCTIQEVKAFQTVLKDYQLNVVSKEHFNAIIYSGPETDKRIYLYHHDGHYDVITSMPAFVKRAYFCTKCNKGYTNKEKHACNDVCHSCFKIHENDASAKWIYCDQCNRFFKGIVCFENHAKLTKKGNSTCLTYYKCAECGSTVERSKKHKCGDAFCKICKTQMPRDHRCYMIPISAEVKDTAEPMTDENNISYIFFDFECLVNEGVHEPNLCVCHKVCGQCIDKENTVCVHCGDREMIFTGENTRDDFCKWLFDARNKGSIVIAHNSKAYDSYFLLKYSHTNAILPSVILNGTKIMSIHVKTFDIKIIDSINFLPMALSKLPATFGLQELHKGYFPHLFNTKKNQSVVLDHLPETKYYSPDYMKEPERQKFFKWYNEHKNDEFNFQESLLKYCRSDVDILRRCCLEFRRLFMDVTGIDPFESCITIASACNLVFRTKFLKTGSIAIIPPHGYNPEQKQSVKAMQWIKYISHISGGLRIKHARNGGEFRVGHYPVDGFYAIDGQKHVLQFHGCFWHGCPKCYSRDTVNPVNEKTMNDLYQTTLQRKQFVESQGYIYHEMWECMWDKRVREDKDIGRFVDDTDLMTPLEPRSAFYGGRTEGFKMFHEVGKDEEIRYVDFTSLYPYVNKYGKYPVGHPMIITENLDNDISQYEGLIKCKVLPPRNLYLPVLPSKINGKLMFSLCRTCAESEQQTRCDHNDGERAFIGTWCSDEIKKAVSKNYLIQKVYEVWHFGKFVQYDRETCSGGLFADYVDTFLKLKQQSSGWPTWCRTDEEKKKYVDTYLTTEGIQLDPQNIKTNPGLRALAKLMLNSFWGKFGQRTNLTKTTYISDASKYLDMMTSDQQQIKRVRLVNDEMVEMQWCNKDEFIEPAVKVNVVIAAYTTTHARLKLYEIMEALGERVLYCDTDSCVYTHRPGEYSPPLGDCLGQLTSELDVGDFITTFVTGGPKNYAFTTLRGKSVEKVRGITLNYCNSRKVNFQTLSNMVKGVGPSVVPVENEHKITRDIKSTNIVTKNEKKDYRITFTKRIITDHYKTLPYGF